MAGAGALCHPSLDMLEASIITIADAVERNREIIDSVMTKYFTKDLFSRFIPEQYKQMTHNISNEEILNLPFRTDILDLPDESHICLSPPACAGKLMDDSNRRECDAQESSVRKVCKVCSNGPSLNAPSNETKRRNTFVGLKKEHEIENMISVILKLVEKTGIKNIVDIGSGRGILGYSLSKEYGLDVLGVESSDVCIHGGMKRAAKIERKQCLQRTHAMNANHNCAMSSVNKERHKEEIRHESRERSSENGIPFTNRIAGGNYSCTIQPGANTHGIEYCPAVPGFVKTVDHDKTGGYFSTILYELKEDQANQSYLIKHIAGHHNFGSSGYLLVALHACGNLTPNILKLFTKDSSAKGLCVVGCCYNLLTDVFHEGNTLISGGFPMSSVLKRRQFYLSRAGGHLACQCPIKAAWERRLPEKSLLYRAIFEIILTDLGQLPSDADCYPRLRRIFKKHNDFTSYAKACLQKLSLQSIKLDDKQLQEYHEKYKDHWQKLLFYNQVHASLAPFLEILIVLDRLVYLRERGHEESHVEQLFCPLISPRCFALVSLAP